MNSARQLALLAVTAFPLVATAASADQPRATSSYIRSAIAEGLPRYAPPAAPTATTSAPAKVPAERVSVGGITTMPRFTVRESKLPSEEKIRTYKAWTQPLIDKYMGPSDGIDRGFLNRFTMPQLWRKIPFLGLISSTDTTGIMSVTDRALDDAGANNPLRTGPIE